MKYKYSIEIIFNYDTKLFLLKGFEDLIESFNDNCASEWLYYTNDEECFTSEYTGNYNFLKITIH